MRNLRFVGYSFYKTLIPAFILLVFSDACIERLNIASENLEQTVVVVDGQITDQPGPYFVRVFKASNNAAVLNRPELVVARQVTIFDDVGEFENLTLNEVGVYQTSPEGIRGIVGREYGIRIELTDGTMFESVPDELKAGPKIDTAYFEWDETNYTTGPTRYGFKIFLDSKIPSTENTYLRWRFSGVYQVQTFPENNIVGSNCNPASLNFPPSPDPLPCSGVIFTGERFRDGSSGPGTFVRVSECSCCDCWITDSENKPKVSNDAATVSEYRKIDMGYIPFDAWRFGKGKYMVTVEQMTLTPSAYEFWKVFKDQKEGGTSLFQPSFGRSKTNLYSTNSNREISGIFYASTVDSKVLFLTAADAQIPIPPYDIEPPDRNCALWGDCTDLFYNASLSPPAGW